MNQPDWSKAPEGATHAVTTGPKWNGGSDLVGTVEFAQFANGEYHRVNGHGGWFCIGDSGWVVLAERPSGWPGEGLPPVGTVCRALVPFGDAGGYVWRDVKVAYHHEMDREALVFDVSTTRPTWADEFQPLRTPEQIAAEERLHNVCNACNAIAETLDGLRGKTKVERAALAVVEAMIDAGYRKVEGGEV